MELKSQSISAQHDTNNSLVTNKHFLTVIEPGYNEPVDTRFNVCQILGKAFIAIAQNPYVWVILIAFTIRLTTIGLYPLGDTTEARYSEIARKIVETGNWVVPQYEYGVPFWGKPPLSIWFQAISFKFFGINEFAARLSSIIISLLIVILVFNVAKQQINRTTAWIASALLSTNVLFYLLSGAVLMDPLMTLGTTLSMLSFWQAMKDRGRYWGYLFFVGIAIGLMSKGPVAAVLITLPIIVWLALSRNWQQCRLQIPIVSGTVLLLTLTLPWYLLAEYYTPGFLKYYIIGEHWDQFMTPGWQGNRFGATHSSYIGAIWVEWLIAAFPMSLILIGSMVSTIWRKKTTTKSILHDDWTLFLIIWVTMLMVFFTFSGNTTITYILPSLPATALLVAGLWPVYQKHSNNKTNWARKSITITAIAGLAIPLLYLAVVLLHLPTVADDNSEKFLVEQYYKSEPSGQARLVYLYTRPSSAEFYSSGKAEVINSPAELQPIVNSESSVFFAVEPGYEKQIADNLRNCMNKIGQFGRHFLFHANQSDCKI